MEEGTRGRSLVFLVAIFHRDLVTRGPAVVTMADVELPLVEHAASGGQVQQQMAARALDCPRWSARPFASSVTLIRTVPFCPRSCERIGNSVSLWTTRMPQAAATGGCGDDRSCGQNGEAVGISARCMSSLPSPVRGRSAVQASPLLAAAGRAARGLAIDRSASRIDSSDCTGRVLELQ